MIILPIILVICCYSFSYANDVDKCDKYMVKKIVTVGYDVENSFDLFGTDDIEEINATLQNICENLWGLRHIISITIPDAM